MKNFFRSFLLVISLLGSNYISSAGWEQVGSFGGVVISALAVNGRYMYVGTGGNGVFRSNDSGKTWVQAGLVGYSILGLKATDSSLVAGTNSVPGSIFVSSNHGDSWEDAGLQSRYFRAFASNHDTLIAGTIFSNTGVYNSVDHGKTWTRVNEDSIANIQAFAFFRPNLLFAATDDGVFRSSNNGKNWTSASVGLGSAGVATIVSMDSILVVGTRGGGINVSTDQGESWAPRSYGLSIKDVTALAVDGMVLFAATDAGSFDPADVFVSQDNGVHWSYTNLWVRSVACLAIKPPYIFAGAGIGGVYRQYLGNILSVRALDSRSTLLSPTLDQNFPNPFNPDTRIEYTLPKSGSVTLRVFNTLGQIVATLIEGPQAAGHQSVAFDATKLPSGLYFYQLHAGAMKITKKMILSR